MILARCDIHEGKSAVRMRFEKAGDVLADHAHAPNSYHDVVVVKGRVAVYGVDWRKEVQEGCTLVLEDREMRHAIAALDPGTEILNLYRNPMPTFAAQMGRGWMEIEQGA